VTRRLVHSEPTAISRENRKARSNVSKAIVHCVHSMAGVRANQMRVRIPLVPQACRISCTAAPWWRTTRGGSSMVTTSKARTVSKSRRPPWATEPMPPEPPARKPPTEALASVDGTCGVPSLFCGLPSQGRRDAAGLANGDAVGRNFFELVHKGEIENDAAMERDTLAVVSGSRTTGVTGISCRPAKRRIARSSPVLMGCTATSPFSLQAMAAGPGSTSKSRAKGDRARRARSARGRGRRRVEDSSAVIPDSIGREPFETLENDLEIYLRLRVDPEPKKPAACEDE